MIEVSVVTEIDASAATVWRILTNLPDYHAWNPFIRYARGSLEVGGNVRLQVHTSWRVPLFFHAGVIEREEARVLRWRGTVVGPWLASGDHSFTILPQAPREN